MQELYFHTFQITIIATADSCFDAWIGAFVRANFLSAAESIVVEPQGKTLRNIISGEASDSLRGFAFSFPADAQPTICLNSTQAISFEIHLIGCISNYYLKIIQALQAMCNKGMGHP
ncbi:MAG: hypothetical protein LBR97_04825, partial [Dysgonamonadaceae bacterium]|nr:hypothetical protein [Dysgonamonadaceae bacterium]